MMMDELLDTLRGMLLQEQAHYVCVDYMKHEHHTLLYSDDDGDNENHDHQCSIDKHDPQPASDDDGHHHQQHQQRYDENNNVQRSLSLTSSTSSCSSVVQLFCDKTPILSMESPRSSCCNVVKTTLFATNNDDCGHLLYRTGIRCSCSSIASNSACSCNIRNYTHEEAMIQIRQYYYQQKMLYCQQQYKYEHTFTYWRYQMFDWACMVVDTYHIDRNVIAISFNLLDRYVYNEMNHNHHNNYSSSSNTSSSSSYLPITREDYQLFSMVCLYIATKLVSCFVNNKLTIGSLVDMSRNYYTREVIVATEYDIYQSLNWYMNPPTSMDYCRLFVSMLSLLSNVPKTTTTPTPIDNNSNDGKVNIDDDTNEEWKREQLLSSSSTIVNTSERTSHDANDNYYNNIVQTTAQLLIEITIANPMFVSYPSSYIGLAATIHATTRIGTSSTSSTNDNNKIHLEQMIEFCNIIQPLIDIDNNILFCTIYQQMEKMYCQCH